MVYFRRDTDGFARFYRCQVDGFLEKLPGPDTAFSDKTLAKARKVVMEHAADIWERSMYRGDLQQWSIDQGPNRNVVLKARREQRFAEILERLRNSGWGGEVDYLDRLGILTSSLSRYPSVRQSIELTERGWLTVQEVLKHFLESTRKRRLKLYRESFSNLEQAIISHCIQIPRNATMDCRPQFIDLAMDEDIRALIEYPGTTVVSATAFSALVPSLVANWHAERKKELTEFFSPYLGLIPDGIDPLSLATAAIACGWCSAFSEVHVFDHTPVKVLRYPDILAHDCTHLVFPEHTKPPYDPDKDLYAKAAMTTWLRPLEFHLEDWEFFGAPFSVARATYFNFGWKTGIKCMRDVVSAIGLDPSRATMEDVRQCKARLRCATCKASWERDIVWSGEAALRHAVDRHKTIFDDRRIEWERVGGKDLATAHAMESESVEWQHLSLSTDNIRWACSLCPDWSTGPPSSVNKDLSSHLKEEHNIDDPDACVESGIIYPHPGHSNVFLAEPPIVPIEPQADTDMI